MQGNPVLPMIIRKDPNKSGKTACSNDIMESGVSVKPRSLNIDAGVKMPLIYVRYLNKISYLEPIPPDS